MHPGGPNFLKKPGQHHWLNAHGPLAAIVTVCAQDILDDVRAREEEKEGADAATKFRAQKTAEKRRQNIANLLLRPGSGPPAPEK
jgi:hypothetical protein